jgi:NADPH-dependent glutamate synthase beta subunit-like oxidoreductase/ferredoxin
LSVAWQLGLKGHAVDLYEAEKKLGGKIELCIPRERLPRKVLLKELSRFGEIGVTAHVGKRINRKAYDRIYGDHDIVVVACGAHKPRKIEFPGSDKTVAAIDFLKGVNFDQDMSLKRKRVVIIGAGNVGMDVASEAFNCGAASVTAVDIQQPAAFGKEMEMARAKGTGILWPKVTERYDRKAKKIFFRDGTFLEADLVIMSVGEIPILDFLPPDIHTERGWIKVNDLGQTSDVKVFAIGDATRPGLVTHAIGQGRVAADVIHSQLMHYDYMPEVKLAIPYEKVKTEYYDLCRFEEFEPKKEAELCMSCGSCRDCHMCEATCYWGAISRKEGKDGSYEYVVDDDKCIGCGFCVGVCPCGVWEMVENI